MINAVLITESLRGTHRPSFSFPVTTISTRGTGAIYFSQDTLSYKVSKSVTNFIQNEKPDIVFLGSDLDQTGTKIATVVNKEIQKINETLRKQGLREIKTLRTAFTEKGYMRIGRLYTDSEMRSLAELDLMNMGVAKFFKEKFTNIPTTGLKRAVIVGAVSQIAKNQDKIKVRTQGTATVTAFTKHLLNGGKASTFSKKMEKLYAGGHIEYPRVDNDYFINETPYEVYAHPKLTALGYTDRDISPFEVEELPLNKATIMMALAQERLVTPSMVVNYFKTIEEVFDDNLKPKEEFTQYVKECESIYREYESEYREILQKASPRSRMLRTLTPTKIKKKEELDEWLEKVKKRMIEEFEREEMEKKQQRELQKKFKQKKIYL